MSHVVPTRANTLGRPSGPTLVYATKETVREVIFPSRHAAVSGKPCLTLHPMAYLTTHSEKSPIWGRSGFAPPPNPRIGPWWRLLHQKWKRMPSLILTLT